MRRTDTAFVTFNKGSIMNKTPLLLSTLLGVATITAQAGELYAPAQYQAPAASTVSRAQVRQSVLQARANGALEHNDVDLPSYSRTA